MTTFERNHILTYCRYMSLIEITTLLGIVLWGMSETLFGEYMFEVFSFS